VIERKRASLWPGKDEKLAKVTAKEKEAVKSSKSPWWHNTTGALDEEHTDLA
jgi:hypothetical protein